MSCCCSTVPEDLNRVQSLRHFDIRLNKLKGRLPQSLEDLPLLLRLNVRGNRLSEVSTAHTPHLELLNCTDNSLRTLTVNEGPVKIITARNNSKLREGRAAGSLLVFIDGLCFCLKIVEQDLIVCCFQLSLPLLFLSMVCVLAAILEITQFVVSPTCENLTSIDISRLACMSVYI